MVRDGCLEKVKVFTLEAAKDPPRSAVRQQVEVVKVLAEAAPFVPHQVGHPRKPGEPGEA